jgi:hypothetical protein
MMNDAVLQETIMQRIVRDFGTVDAERFISLVIKEPFDYTKWQRTLYEGMSVEDISKRALDMRSSRD